MSIVLGFIAKENVMYGVIGAVADYDVQNIIFQVCVILGCVLLFIMLCMICLAYKRNCFVHWIFVFILTICFVVYTVLGVAIMYAAIYSADQLEELCSESSTSSNDFKDAMDELYETCDTFYCTGVCLCDLNFIPVDLARNDYIGSSGAPAQNVQDCEALIEALLQTMPLILMTWMTLLSTSTTLVRLSLSMTAQVFASSEMSISSRILPMDQSLMHAGNLLRMKFCSVKY